MRIPLPDEPFVGEITVRVSKLILSAVVGVCVVSGPAYADSIAIHVFSTSYTTSVSSLFQDYDSGTGTYTPISDARTTTASAPIDDAMLFGAAGYAIADAEFLSVSTNTAAAFRFRSDFVDRTAAEATSILDFSPITDAAGGITVALAAFGSAQHSNGSVTLRNLTTGTTVWDMGWDRPFGPVVYGVKLPTSPLTYAGPQTVPTVLLASDLYRLTISARTNAQGDSQAVTLTASGLHTVPEPAGWLLATLGAVVVIRRRRALTGRTVFP
jgi:hypothetical protein